MWHTAFIALHAAAAAVAFVAGCLALRRAGLYRTYLVSLVGMAVFLVLAVAVGWGANDAATNIVFAALGGLAGFMVWRGLQAGRVRASAAHFDHIGFTLVGLADGFLVVTVLRLGAPGWLLAATGIGAAAAGHLALGATRARLGAGAAGPAPVSR